MALTKQPVSNEKTTATPGAVAVVDKTKSAISAYVDQHIGDLAIMAQVQGSVDEWKQRLIVGTMMEIQKSQQLQQIAATGDGMASIYECLGNAASAGAMIGGAHPEATLVPSYGGRVRLEFDKAWYIRIATTGASAVLRDVICNIRYEKETFKIDFGTGRVVHEWDGGPRGEAVGCYVVLVHLNGRHDPKYFSRDEIYERFRAKSQGYNAFKDGKTTVKSPWHTHELDMWIKSCLKSRLRQYAKAHAGLENAMSMEDYADSPIEDRAGHRLDNVIEAQTVPTIQAQPEPQPQAGEKADLFNPELPI